MEFVLGRFAKVRKTGKVVEPQNSQAIPGRFVRIETFEEKGTDVAIGVQLVADGLLGRFDRAYLISNDTDLCGAVEAVRELAGKDVFVINPTQRFSNLLSGSATKYVQLSSDLVRACELPLVIHYGSSTIVRPTEWT